MGVLVRLPGPLREAVGGEAKVEVPSGTLAEVFAAIDRRHPGFVSRVLDDSGDLRSYVNVYVGDLDARSSGGLATAVPDGSEVMVIPAMSGGSEPGGHMGTLGFARTAHPYRDTDVIDARAPRTNQAIVGALSLLAVLTGWWGILAVVALQLAIGLTFGRRYCLPCLFYFEVIQPRLGEGPIEDSRPPRFANFVGVAFLGSASVAYAAGWTATGVILGGIVAALALLAAITGLCIGCEIYRVAARLRGIRGRTIDRVDLAELGAVVEGEVVVEFTHPLCTDCRELERKLRADGRALLTVDVSRRPDIARKYGVTVVPTAVVVGVDGVVRLRIA